MRRALLSSAETNGDARCSAGARRVIDLVRQDRLLARTHERALALRDARFEDGARERLVDAALRDHAERGAERAGRGRERRDERFYGLWPRYIITAVTSGERCADLGVANLVTDRRQVVDFDHGLDDAALDEATGDRSEPDADLQLEARAILPDAREQRARVWCEPVDHVIAHVRERLRVRIGAMPPKSSASCWATKSSPLASVGPESVPPPVSATATSFVLLSLPPPPVSAAAASCCGSVVLEEQAAAAVIPMTTMA